MIRRSRILHIRPKPKLKTENQTTDPAWTPQKDKKKKNHGKICYRYLPSNPQKYMFRSDADLLRFILTLIDRLFLCPYLLRSGSTYCPFE